MTAVIALLFILLIGTISNAEHFSVTVTSYCLQGKMASGPRTYPGVIALSRDLERDLKAKFGDTIILHGIGTFVFKDRMPKKWKLRVDVYLPTHRACMQFGVKKTTITRK